MPPPVVEQTPPKSQHRQLPTSHPLSTLSTHIAAHSTPTGTNSQHHALAVQIEHNLRYQHNWTSLQIHTHLPFDRISPNPSRNPNPHPSDHSPSPLPRPLISGQPPSRIYVHPDDQRDELKRSSLRAAQSSRSRGHGRGRGKVSSGAIDTGKRKDEEDDIADDDDEEEAAEIEIEREWVLPTHLSEKWTLLRFAAVFDAIGEEPPLPIVMRDDNDDEDGEQGKISDGEDANGNEMENDETHSRSKKKRRRGGKRVLMATVDDDSTVMYYIIHEGVVKPRQN